MPSSSRLEAPQSLKVQQSVAICISIRSPTIIAGIVYASTLALMIDSSMGSLAHAECASAQVFPFLNSLSSYHARNTHSDQPTNHLAMSTVPATYKAYLYDTYGTVEDVLKLAEVRTEPLLGTHVRIQVHCAAINPIDWKVVEFAGARITGGSPSVAKPYGIGFDVAGVVVEVGADVEGFVIGDEVFATAPTKGFGTIAEYFSIDAQFVAMKPTSVGFDQAASLPLVALTTYQALVETAKIQSGETVVVLGGTTSTGLFGIQYAKSIGARVVATTSSKNVALVKSLGADLVVDYTSQQWTDTLNEHSVDVVLDNAVDPASWDEKVQALLRKDTGRFVTLSSIYEPGPSKFGAAYNKIFALPSGKQLATVAKLVDEGKIQPIIDSTYSFKNAVAAFSRSKTGRAVGKIVISILQ